MRRADARTARPSRGSTIKFLRLVPVFLALLLLVAWGAPHLLETGRYRAGIESFASSRLGRPIAIEGPIRLDLLPEPVISAERIRIADRGDGMSATIGALRLQVAPLPLLAGRLVPRTLTLDNPVLHAPWPLPRGAVAEAASSIPLGFSATVRRGTVVIGGLGLGTLAGELRRDPDTGAFRASLDLRAGRLPWRLLGLLGRPDPTGVAPLSLTFESLQPGELHAHFTGLLLPGGKVSGVLRAGGDRLGRLLPGPDLPWQASGPVTASETRIAAPALLTALAGSPGQASLTLDMRTARLSGSMSLGTLDIRDWRRWSGASDWAKRLPLDLTLSLSDARLGPSDVRNIELALRTSPAEARIDLRRAELPGHVQLQLGGIFRGRNGIYQGHFTASGADAAQALRWAGLPDAIAAEAALQTLALSGDATASAAALHLDGLKGRLGSDPFTGTAGLDWRKGPDLALAVTSERLDLEPLLRAGQAAFGSGFTAKLDLGAATASAAGMTVRQPHIVATLGPAGLLVQQFRFDLGGGHGSGSGELRQDGTLREGNFRFDAPDAAGLLAALPPQARLEPSLWTGTASFAAQASGPPSALDLQIRGLLGDLQLQLQSRIDWPGRAGQASLSLRHPGAPRLLAALGFPDPASVIDSGSFALAASCEARPGRLDCAHMALGAGLFRGSGRLSATLENGEPAIDAALTADTLTLPTSEALFGATRHPDWFQGWHGAVRIEAERVLLGLRPEAAPASADLLVSGGVAALSGLQAQSGTQRLAGDLALDPQTNPPRLVASVSLAPFQLPPAPAAEPLYLGPAQGELHATLSAEGFGAAAWLATLAGAGQGSVRDATVTGIDLTQLAAVRNRHGPRTAFGKGSSPGLNGSFPMEVEQGELTLGPADLAGPEGAIHLQAKIDLANRLADFRLHADPAPALGQGVALRISGPWSALRRRVDPGG